MYSRIDKAVDTAFREHAIVQGVLVLVMLLVVLFVAPVEAARIDWCQGYTQGYVKGYRAATGKTMRPMVPMCPMRSMKRSYDPQDDYENGYLVGYEQGERQ